MTRPAQIKDEIYELLLAPKTSVRDEIDTPSIIGIKEAQQVQFLRSLQNSSPEEKSRIILNNSGFAAAIHKKRKSVTVKFGG